MAKTDTTKNKKSKLSTREQLLDATDKVLAHKGSIDFSLSDISHESGLNTALVKYYFGSKSGLLLGLAKKVIGKSLSKLESLVASDLPADEKLRLHIKGIVNTYYYHPYVNRLLHHLARSENGELGEEISREIVSPMVRAEKAILTEGQDAGIFCETDSMMFYFHLSGACDALFYSRYSLKYEFGVTRITKKLKDEYAEYLCDSILKSLKVT